MSSCRICLDPCEANKRLLDRNFREKAQDIFSMLININKKKLSVCDQCQKKISKYYDFKHKCRQQEEHKDPKSRPLSVGFSVRDGVPSVQNKENKTFDDDSDSLPEEFEEEPIKKKKKRYGPPPTRVHVRFTKEQLATRSKKELYAERRTHICDICGKTMENSRKENHKNFHLGLKPYACDAPDCDQTFRCRTSLRVHVKRVHANEQFPCEQCGKILGSILSLRTHMKSHGEKHFKCELCDLMCLNKSRLEMHMRVHTQKRDYKCPHCPKTFYANSVLTLHMRSHSGEKPYVCHVCRFANAHRILYVKHMQKFHPNEEIYKLCDMAKIAAALKGEQQ